MDKIDASAEVIHFLSSLSLHCFVNEYVFAESDEEIRLIANLENKITQTIAQSNQPETIEILCLAAYRPIHRYDWCHKIAALDHLEDVKKRLIEEPLAKTVLQHNVSNQLPL